MNIDRLHRRFFALAVTLACSSAAVAQSAYPLTIGGAYQWRDIRGSNSVLMTPGDNHVIDAWRVRDAFGNPAPDGTTVGAKNTTTGEIVNPFFRHTDVIDEFSFGAAFGALPTTPWQMRARINGAIASDLYITNDISGVQAMGFVRNAAIATNGLTPTISWSLPTTADGNPLHTRVRIGLFDDLTNQRLEFSPEAIFVNLAANATSYTFADGLLEAGRSYVARVVLEDRQFDAQGIPFIRNRSTTFLNFTPEVANAGNGPVFLPTVDAGGVFNFDLDVIANSAVNIDPFVAVGYDYRIGDGDPNFASVLLPNLGDGLFDLSYLDGGNLVQFVLGAGIEYFFPAAGVDAFSIRGIESGAGVDPDNPTAFATTLTFAGTGAFTGTMTAIREFVPDATVPEPGSLGLFSLALLLMWARRPTHRA